MYIVHVFVQVKAQYIDAFRRESIENAANSIKEPGVARFDVIQQQDDISRFVLVEVYRKPEDGVLHKETAHYKKWRDAVEIMMEVPRSSIKYTNVYPNEEGWN